MEFCELPGKSQKTEARGKLHVETGWRNLAHTATACWTGSIIKIAFTKTGKPLFRWNGRPLWCTRLVSGRPPAAQAAGGKSGLPWARWWVTPTVRKDRESTTENNRRTAAEAATATVKR